MRRYNVALALTVTAWVHGAPAEPESPEQFELAPRHARLPPYGGAKWSSTCAVRLEPASSAEQSARVVAMRTWLPGAKITLAQLGDRARLIELPARGAAPESSGDAEALAEHLGELVAPLFGVGAPAWRVEVAKTRRAWLVDLEMHSEDFTRHEGEHEVAVVVRIDRATGAIRIGLVDEVLPIMPACEREPPPIDIDRVIAAVIRHPLPHAPPLTANDMVFDTIVSAAPASDGRSSHGVVRVAVGDHLADLVCGPARDTVRFRTFVWVDATTYEVVGGEIIDGIIHDSAFRLDPIHDAARAFRSKRGASVEP